jgi:integrase
MARAGLMARYRDALVAAGLPATFSFHDLRHTFGTTMARAGVEVGTIQAWLGHADLATTQLYMHYAPQARDARQDRGGVRRRGGYQSGYQAEAREPN